MKKEIIAALLALVMALSGCGAKEPAAANAKGAVTFTDDLEREVTVAEPRRVAALLGSYADVWRLAGGEVCASADDAWEDFGLDMSDDAVNLGQTKALSLERLFEAEPDFILASPNTRINMEWKDTLEASGIATAYFEVANFDDYLRMLKICTDITGRADLYRTNGLDVQKEVEAAVAAGKERAKAAQRPTTVLLLRASASFVRVKNSDGAVAGEMLRSLGCENIADSESMLLESVSLERIMQADPDHIFVLQSGDDRDGMERRLEQELFSRPAWSQLSAVKGGRVHLLEKRLYSLKPNALWGEAYRQLERILSDG